MISDFSHFPEAPMEIESVSLFRKMFSERQRETEPVLMGLGFTSASRIVLSFFRR